MQVDSPFGRIFHWMKKRGRNPKSAPKGAKPRADQSGTIRGSFSKSSLAAPAAWAAFCRGQKPRGLASPLPPKSLRRQKEKPPDWMVSNWSRLRGSNSLPPPWQGGALPDELNLRFSQRCLLYRMEALLSRTFFFKSETPAKFAAPARPPFCFGQTPGNLLRLSPQNLFGDKRKTTQNWVAALAQVTSETSETFPSPLLLPLPYGQHFAGAKTEGTCFASLPQNPLGGKKEKPPKIGWLLWSRLRGSNSLPPPWQGGALPDELNLHTHHRNDVIWCLRSESNQ